MSFTQELWPGAKPWDGITEPTEAGEIYTWIRKGSWIYSASSCFQMKYFCGCSKTLPFCSPFHNVSYSVKILSNYVPIHQCGNCGSHCNQQGTSEKELERCQCSRQRVPTWEIQGRQRRTFKYNRYLWLSEYFIKAMTSLLAMSGLDLFWF